MRNILNIRPAVFLSLSVLFFVFFNAGAWGQSGRSDVKRFNALRDRAVKLAGEGKVNRSLPYFEKMVELQPYNESALYLLSLALLHRDKTPKAEYRRGLKRAVALLNTCVRMQRRYKERSRALGLRLFYLGLAHWYSGDALRALKAFKGSYRADFERLDAVYNHYAVLEELGRNSEARVVRRRYLKLLKTADIDD